MPVSRLARSRLRRVAALVFAMVAGAWVGACSDRQVDVDGTERIEAACRGSCSVALDCDPTVQFDSLDDCIAACMGSDEWDELDQCDWADTDFAICLGTLSCDEYDAYNAFVFDGIELSDAWPCLQQIEWFYNCDPSEPFGPLP